VGVLSELPDGDEQGRRWVLRLEPKVGGTRRQGSSPSTRPPLLALELADRVRRCGGGASFTPPVPVPQRIFFTHAVTPSRR
jgi:hypothetical protein